MQSQFVLAGDEILALLGAVFEANKKRLTGVRFYDDKGAVVLVARLEAVCDEPYGLTVYLQGPDSVAPQDVDAALANLAVGTPPAAKASAGSPA